MNARLLRGIVVPAALSLAAVACGGGAAPDEPAPAAEITTTPAEDTVPPADPAPPGTAAEEPPQTSVEGPPAPDFALALGDGGVFTLSEEQKPVYLVFWAEW